MRLHMRDTLSPRDIEQIADDAGTTIAAICRDAGIARSTFSRWKAGQTSPSLAVYARIRDAALRHAAAAGCAPERAAPAAPVLPDSPDLSPRSVA
jgi:transcriptional regulator with XRE-family HTH domain